MNSRALSYRLYLHLQPMIVALAIAGCASSQQGGSGGSGQIPTAAAEFTSPKETLGPNINTAGDDHAPVISPDGKTLYFVRDDISASLDSGTVSQPTRGAGPANDLWSSTLGADGKWSKAKLVGSPLNTPSPNGIFSVTPDGNTVLLGGGYAPDVNDYSPHISRRTKKGWSAPKAVGVTNFYNRAEVYSHFLANDGRTLIMGLKRDDSRGGLDLYVSTMGRDGSWSEPLNIGDDINTAGMESDAFLASDNRTIYFASDGRGGLGKSDIFMSRRLDSSWARWSTPINLGPSINTADQDWELFIPASADYAYLASRQGSAGGLDIFRIKLPDALRPHPVVLVAGQVLDQKTKRPVAATIVYEILSSGDAAGVAASDPTTGTYGIALPSGASYGFYAEADGYIPVSDNLDLNDLKEYRETQRNLYLVPIEKGQTIRLNNLFFNTAESTIRPESLPELKRIALLLKKYATMTIEVRGHTDDVGNAESNKKLSLDRATAVRQFLLDNGIAAARLTAKGFGSTKPVVANTSDDARQQNRRVEFTIVKK